MNVVFSNVSSLILFLLVGWVLGKKHIISTENLKMLSTLELWVFLPCKTFQGFAGSVAAEYLSEKSVILLVSGTILLLLVFLTRVLVPRFVRKSYEQNIIQYSLTVSNFGFFGYSLIESVFGGGALADAMVFSLPLSFYVYTEGYRLLTRQTRVSLRGIINPVLIAVLIGCIFGLTQWKLPMFINYSIGQAAACMAPVSMLLTGLMLSGFSMKEILTNKLSYLTTVFRLVIIPVVLCFALHGFFSRETVLVAVLMHAMPCGLNTIIFPNLIGEDCRLGASLAMISSLCALVTVPICIYMVEFLC